MIELFELHPAVESTDRQLGAAAQELLRQREGRPPFPRDRTDMDFLITRVGRMQQLLRGLYHLASLNFGTAAAPLARSMWETWINSAWLLLDPKERATAFWASAGPQTLGLVELFGQHEQLNADNQKTRADIEKLIANEPEMYEQWKKRDGNFFGFHSLRWQGQHNSLKAQVNELDARGHLGEAGARPYRRSYDYDYSRLCSATHGDAMELESLMSDLPDGATAFFAGAGKFDAISAALTGTGAALMLVAELWACGYWQGDPSELGRLKASLESLRSGHGS